MMPFTELMRQLRKSTHPLHREAIEAIELQAHEIVWLQISQCDEQADLFAAFRAGFERGRASTTRQRRSQA